MESVEYADARGLLSLLVPLASTRLAGLAKIVSISLLTVTLVISLMGKLTSLEESAKQTISGNMTITPLESCTSEDLRTGAHDRCIDAEVEKR